MKQSGFTLIELMVTVMIIAILATIAYPSYMIYINKSKATRGQQAISAAMTSLEQSYVDNNHIYPATQSITDTNSYFGYTYTQGGTTGTPSAGQSYYINALGNAPLGQYYISANSNDVRCVCMNCSTNPLLAFTDTNTSCPAGSTPW